MKYIERFFLLKLFYGGSMTEKNNKRTIFGWSMYDWAKSAYETTTLGAVMPVYFVSVVVPAEGFNLSLIHI